MENVYLVVIETRQSDNEYYVFASLDNALKFANSYADEYGNYDFEVPNDWPWFGHYKLYLDAGEDCPKIYVKELKVEP